MSLALWARDRWERRLDSWAEWYAIEERGGKVKISALYASIGAGGYGDQRDGAVNAEILETHGFVCKLASKHRQAIVAWYTWTGSPGRKARDLGTSERTLYRWVEHGVENLERLLSEAEHLQTVHSKKRRALAERA